MTADYSDRQSDETLAAVGSLRTPDVSQRRAALLRRRCHTLLAKPVPKEAAGVRMTKGTAFKRIIGPALGGAWCLAYLVEIARRVAAVYLG